ncbi:MAG: hypothetical protein STSR0008_21160 [Ignavibacterium sp.]
MKNKIKILHLEDNPYDSELIKELLNESIFSAEIKVVDNQNDFIQNLQTNNYDIIISDFSLPTFNGKEALLLVKELKPETPFIFLSGTIGEDAAIESLIYGATDYVLKNKPERLIPAIQRALYETEIKQAKIKAEQELILSEEKYREFVNAVNDGFFIVDLDGTINFSNKALALMIGFNKADELVGHKFYEFVIQEQVEEIKRITQEINENNLTFENIEVKIKLIDGQLVYFDVKTFPIFENGQVIGHRGIIRDITERKQAEINLQKRDAILEVISIVAEKFLTTKNVNETINETLKLLCKASDASRVYLFQIYKSINGKLFISQTNEFVNDGIKPQIDNQELRNIDINSSGFIRWLEKFEKHELIFGLVKDFPEEEKEFLMAQDIKSILIVPIYVSEKVWGFIGLDECIYERIWSIPEIEAIQAVSNLISGAITKNNIERELVEAKEKAEEMNRLKSVFLANMSHELRTPLIGILGFSEILLGEHLNIEQEDMINTIFKSGNRLLETVNTILDFSKIESNKIEINYSRINVYEVIKQIVFLFQGFANQKKLFLKMDEVNDNFIFNSDQKILERIINNLINNALKFTIEGGVTVRLKKEIINSQPFCVIEIEDTGIGIPEDKQEIIFEEFRQASEGFSRSHEGTGLGLSITRRFTELLGGSITLKSKLNEGSTFIVKLPMNSDLTTNLNNQEISMDDFDRRIKDVKQNKFVEENIINKEKKEQQILFDEKISLPNILMVENDIISIDVVKIFLKNYCNFDYALDGIQALDMVKNKKYDIILMDISLGGNLDGIEVVQKIRKLQIYKNIPIIAVTAHVQKQDREKFLSGGCTHYLSKPFTKKELIDLLNQILNQMN